jgi:hypothetical protein
LVIDTAGLFHLSSDKYNKCGTWEQRAYGYCPASSLQDSLQSHLIKTIYQVKERKGIKKCLKCSKLTGMPEIERRKKLEILNTKHETNPNDKIANDQNICFEF